MFGALRSGTGNTCSGEHQAGLMRCGRSCHQRAEGARHGGLTQWGRCICGDHPGEGCPGLAGLLLALECAWLLTPGADTHMWWLVGRRLSPGHPSPLTGKRKERLGQQGGQLSQCGGWVRTVPTLHAPLHPREALPRDFRPPSDCAGLFRMSVSGAGPDGRGHPASHSWV